MISESGNDPQISGLEISNNTIIAKANDAPWIGIDLTSMENGTGTGIDIRNNIVVGFNDAWLKGSSPRPGISSLSARNNIIYGNGNSNQAVWPGGKPGTYTYTGNLITSPVLAANYTPATGSPAIKAGTDGTDIGFTGGSGTSTPSPCSYTYSDWGPCVNGVQTRSVLSSSPAGCTGTPVLTQTCTVNPPPVLNDTIPCSVILYGANLTRKTVTRIIKKADGYYDGTTKRDIWLYKRPDGVWMVKGTDGKYTQFF